MAKKIKYNKKVKKDDFLGEGRYKKSDVLCKKTPLKCINIEYLVVIP